jgi:RNase P/RNase MRP subunit p30
MKKYADLHVRLTDMNNEVLTQTGRCAKEMGFDLLGIVVPASLGQNQTSAIKQSLIDTGVDVTTRIDITPKDRNHLLSQLRSMRKMFEIVAVECTSPQIARIACRDRRVDVVSFPIMNRYAKFQSRIASLCRASIEINIAQIISPRNTPRHWILSRLTDQVTTAKTSNVPIILSSGATNPLMLRAPREIAAIGSLLGLETLEALESVSRNPFKIIERNRSRLSPDHVAFGVKLER